MALIFGCISSIVHGEQIQITQLGIDRLLNGILDTLISSTDQAIKIERDNTALYINKVVQLYQKVGVEGDI